MLAPAAKTQVPTAIQLAGQGSALAAPLAVAPTPVGLSIQQLKREIDALQGLPEGRLPQQIRLPALFEIDLADPAAVSERVDTLPARAATQVAPAADEMAALRLTRDGLRLQFLHLPVARSEQGGVPAPNYHTGPMQ